MPDSPELNDRRSLKFMMALAAAAAIGVGIGVMLGLPSVLAVTLTQPYDGAEINVIRRDNPSPSAAYIDPELYLRWEVDPAPTETTYFLICFDIAENETDCPYPQAGSNRPPWAHEASDPELNQAPVRGAPTKSQYRFTTDELHQASLDRDIIWTVGICSAQDAATCNFATPRRFSTFSANLAITGFSFGESQSNRTMVPRVTITNNGYTDVGGSKTRIRFYDILFNDRKEPCRALAQAPDANTMILTRYGNLLTYQEAYDSRQTIAALVRTNGLSIPDTTLRTNALSVLEFDQLEVSPAITFSASDLPKMVAAVIRADIDNDVREADERHDNLEIDGIVMTNNVGLTPGNVDCPDPERESDE